MAAPVIRAFGPVRLAAAQGQEGREIALQFRGGQLVEAVFADAVPAEDEGDEAEVGKLLFNAVRFF